MPSKDSMPKKKPVYSDKRKKKPTVHTPEGSFLNFMLYTAVYKPSLHYAVEYNCLFLFALTETSEVVSPTSEVAQPIATATDVTASKEVAGNFAHTLFLVAVRSQAYVCGGYFT